MPHEQRVAWILCLALLAFCALASALYGRVERAFGLPRAGRLAFRALLAAACVCAVLPRFFAGYVGALAAPFGTFAACVVLSVLVSSVLLAPYLLASKLKRLLERTARDQQPPANPGRRAFVEQAAVGGALSIGVGATLYGTLLGRHDYRLEQVPIKLAKLPRALSGFSIVQLSDLHVGSFVSEYEFARGLELVKRARPDLIVLTGDLIDHDVRYLPALGRFVRALGAHARHGVYAVAGNHDHYAGVEAVEAVLRAAGAQPLTNRHVRIGDAGGAFVLAGLDDIMGYGSPGRGPDLKRALAAAPPELARVLLSHNPGYFPTSYASADLTLSGHTHGGQISLFINPAQLILRHGFVRGHYAHAGSQLYVNRGFGTAGPPTRVGSPPEVTQLVLTS